MKKILLFAGIVIFIASCKDKTAATTTGDATTPDSSQKTPTDLPYKASYSSDWNSNVSDADLKMVLQTYKDWEQGNMSGLSKAMGDSVSVDFSSGNHFIGTGDSLMKIWVNSRDSLSSVAIDMEAWHKMHAVDRNEDYVVTWYKETDTYKGGKVDSAYYQDINLVKKGKISWYSQYKRPAK
jgi:hypothetical protein